MRMQTESEGRPTYFQLRIKQEKLYCDKYWSTVWQHWFVYKHTYCLSSIYLLTQQFSNFNTQNPGSADLKILENAIL